MKRLVLWLVTLVLLSGVVTAEAKEDALWESMQERKRLYEELQGEEIWRKRLGKERCLLLYIDETGKQRICFTDGPWMYLTEQIVERVKEAGMKCWQMEEKNYKKIEKDY